MSELSPFSEGKRKSDFGARAAFDPWATWAMSVYAFIDILERMANECRSRRIPRAYKMERVTDKRRSSGIHVKPRLRKVEHAALYV
jgi:hypothetical protein